MLGEPKEIRVAWEWVRLTSSNPITPIDPPVFVLPVPGGVLMRVVVPGNPVVFIPNLTLADLQGQSP